MTWDLILHIIAFSPFIAFFGAFIYAMIRTAYDVWKNGNGFDRN